METVAFYSYKGGVGRTLLVANTAQFLALSGRRVVALDLDLEAPGLHQKLGSQDVLIRAEEGTLRGAVDELLDSLGDGPRDHTLRETAIPIDMPTGTTGSLHLISAGAAPSQAYWAALRRLNDALRIRRTDGGLLEAVLELQARIADEFAPDFLLIDSRTGITELGGLATSILADRVICLTTAAPESVAGTRVVADALRAAPRLPSQEPIQVEFLVTRVTSVDISPIAQELGGSVAVLRHDSGIADEERVLTGWRPHTSDSTGVTNTGTGLLADTLDWIATSFPEHEKDAVAARNRMTAVHQVWQDLTRTRESGRGWTRPRAAWPERQLRQRVRFGNDGSWRQADIVVYDAPSDDPNAKPLMVVEFVQGEHHDGMAQWWVSQARVQVVVMMSGTKGWYYTRILYGASGHRSERWDLPLPHDFTALSDPTDVSVDALLDAVRRGHPEYLERLVAEWVHCSASTLHGGAPWKPEVAKKIEDALARVDDVETARHVLWAATPDVHRGGLWLGDGDDCLDDQVHAELFAPLLWRLPTEASIEILRESSQRGKPHGRPAGLLALALLARDILGLRYDPDAVFRTAGQRILDQLARDMGSLNGRALYDLTPQFEHTEASFEISSGLPRLATSETVHEGPQEPVDLGDLLSGRIEARSLVTTGLLGDYQPPLGRVILYSSAISQCAEKLSLRARHVGSVVLIHETLHALAHLGRDLDGRMWPDFALSAADGPLFEPSWFHEVLTQYFTYQHLVRLRDPELMHAFEVMSDKQAPPYRAWQRMRDLPIEDARAWLMSVRRGVGGAAPSVLFEAMRDGN